MQIVLLRLLLFDKIYSHKTDADDVASLPINLALEPMKITAEYNGKVITNTIVVSKP